jgi:mono/diheme cytochrome c family protein
MRHAVLLMLTTALLAPSASSAQDSAAGAQVKRGEYLVTVGGCHDCHTPWTIGSNGPEPDMKRGLSGHPQDIVIRAPAKVAEPWSSASSPTNTAWSGPWGVSFTANLTPDPETGVLRDFTEQQFIQTLRTGRHQGQGRQILPPMPWPNYGQMTDDDLKAVFAYLRQVPPVKNKVPDPLPPVQ